MAISSGTLTVGVTAIQVDGNSVQPAHIHIRNNDNVKTLFVGGSDVTPSNGLPVDKLATIDFDIPPGQSVYMVTDIGTVSVSWLKVTY